MKKIGVQIDTQTVNGEQMYVVKTPYSPRMTLILRGIPGRRWWEPELKAWVCRISGASTQYLKDMLPMAVWGGEAQEAVDVLVPKKQKAPPKNWKSLVRNYKFETKPFDHQGVGFAISRDVPAYALFMEQRTGKTKLTIDTIAYLYEQGQIDGAIVITLSSVRSTWVEEFETHFPKRLEYSIHSWDAKRPDDFLRWLPGSNYDGKLGVLVVNVEGLARKNIEAMITKFVRKYKKLFGVVDESTAIANPTAKRTKAVYRIGDACDYRRIATGTPIKQSPLDLYGQFKFLDERIFRMTYTEFKRYVAEWEGYQVMKWQNLDGVRDTIDGFFYRVLRKDVFKDLPEATFQRREVELSAEQAKLYKQLENKMAADHDGKRITADIVIKQYLRLSQLVGGFIKWDDDEKVSPVPGENPKMNEVLTILDEEPPDSKVIVWARFQAECDLITKTLRKKYGKGSAVEYRGGMSTAAKDASRKAFQDRKSSVRFLVGQVETGGIGIDLDAASAMIYYSNSYRYEAREQSLARPMSARQKVSVGVYDIIAEGTIDELVLSALKMKKDLAAMIDKKHVANLMKLLGI